MLNKKQSVQEEECVAKVPVNNAYTDELIKIKFCLKWRKLKQSHGIWKSNFFSLFISHGFKMLMRIFQGIA